MVSMKNVTITMEDKVLEWVRVEAARRGNSVSRMVGDLMAEMMQREDAYERAYLAWRTDERTWQAEATAKVASRSASSKRMQAQSAAVRSQAPQSGGDA